MVGDKPAESWDAVYDQSVQAFNRADFDEARAVADSGYRAWCRQPASQRCSLFRLLLAESLIELDRLKEARPLLNVSTSSPESEARRFADLAMLHFRSHEDEEAQQSLTAARGVQVRHSGELAGKIDLIGGMLQLHNDQTADAEGSLRRALAAVQGSDSLIESYALTDLGFLDLRRFHYDEALYWYGRARDLAERKGMKRALELATFNRGAAYLELGDLDKAIENLGEAAKVAEQLQDRVYHVAELNLLGEAWSRTGDLDKAAGYYQKARELGNPDRDRWLASVLDDLSRLALRKGDLASADDLNAQGIALAQRLEGPQALLEHRIQSGAIALARKQYSTAEKIFEDALAGSVRAEDPIDTFECHAALSTLYRETGSPAKAGAELRAAAATIDRLHSGLQQDESKFSFLSSMIDFYHDYVDFLFDGGDPAAAFRVAESSRARVLEERLHRDESSAPAADLKSLKEEAAASGAILLSYWLAPHRSLLWVIDSAGLHSFQLPPEAEIAAQVRRYNDAIQRGDNPIEGGNDAGRWLFANLLATHYHVPKNSNVVIEADGALHQLNFESLPAEDGGQYWIDDATISVAPSLALLQRSAYASGGRLLAFGDPGYEGTEFQRLSNAKAELQAVGSHFTEKEVYVASAATPAAYRAAHPETFSILHFATHAVANRESPLDSAIVLAGPPDSRKLYAREILETHLTAELVTLSACQTAGSRTYYGEGLTGFSWAFLSAGARNVVAGLWDVDDRATAELMKDFYDELGSGPAPVNALRRAKLRLLASGGAYRKPRYWAAFETFTRAIY